MSADGIRPACRPPMTARHGQYDWWCPECGAHWLLVPVKDGLIGGWEWIRTQAGLVWMRTPSGLPENGEDGE